MKCVTIEITPQSDEREILGSLDRKLKGVNDIGAEESLLLQNAKMCACDFVVRAQKQYASGTTIQLRKDFQFPYLKLSLRLSIPGRRSVLDRFVAFFRRD